MLTLNNRVCRNECKLGAGTFDIVCAFYKPQRNVVQILGVTAVSEYKIKIRFLFFSLFLRTYIGRVTDQKNLIFPIVWAHRVPWDTRGIPRAYLTGLFKWNQWN